MDLLSSCTSGGCGAKIGPGELSTLLSGLEVYKDPQLILGFDSHDDAAVYRMNPTEAIVSTLDFFSPMVNDPYLFGKIAAANALSDVYAMGAEPIFALNMVCFPEKMDKAILSAILSGGAEKLMEAQIPLAGGHSIYDHEIKYGLCVTGKVHPDHMLKNNTCKPGDQLILTKALGVGIVMAAHRVNLADAAHYGAATASMERLNRYAAQAAKPYAPTACTDVTGFGLLAHLCEMVGDTLTAVINPSQLPLLPGAYSYAADYLLTAAGQRNRHYVEGLIGLEGLSKVDFPLQEVMLDPQTSGGLLFTVPKNWAKDMLTAISALAPDAAIIGEIRERSTSPITFLGGNAHE